MKSPLLALTCAGFFTAAVHAAPPVIKRTKAAITTPLFIQKAVGVNAMSQVTLHAKAIPTKPAAPGIVAFVPPLGPAGKAVLDSMFGDWECDATCAVVGHLQADGKIVSVGSALSRLLTAIRGGASRILLPEKNVGEAATDVMVNEGIDGFGRVQMFAVKDFDEIPMMAGAKMDPLVVEAIAAFKETQVALAAAGKDAAVLLRETDTQESLRTVLEKWPNHISARLLLGNSIGRYKTLSPAGSAQVIDLAAATLFAGVNSGSASQVRNLPLERIEANLAALAKYADRVDPKARGLVAHLVAYGEAARTFHKEPPRTQKDATALATKLSTEAALAQDERQKLARVIFK